MYINYNWSKNNNPALFGRVIIKIFTKKKLIID